MWSNFTVNPALALPVVSRLSPRVVRIMGLNPGPMTLGGTNTYLVGMGQRRLLIDTGEGKLDYAAALQEALDTCSSELGSKVHISQVVFTHWHHDHIGGWRQVQQLFPDVAGLKLPTRVFTATVAAGGTAPSIEQEVRNVRDGEVLVYDEGKTTLSLFATPGHTDDHLSLLLHEENAIFTGDCVLGAGSSVFSSYIDFMRSLKAIKDMQPKLLYPGHGPVATEAGPYLDAYIQHRVSREEQILQALQSRPYLTIDELVAQIYTTTPPQLLVAASLNVSHQLKKLFSEGRVTASDESGASVTTDIIPADEYISSAGGTMITAALGATTRSDAEPSATGDGSCNACDAAAQAGARALTRLKSLRWSLAPSPASPTARL